jgi:hypothetical protein
MDGKSVGYLTVPGNMVPLSQTRFTEVSFTIFKVAVAHANE